MHCLCLSIFTEVRHPYLRPPSGQGSYLHSDLPAVLAKCWPNMTVNLNSRHHFGKTLYKSRS